MRVSMATFLPSFGKMAGNIVFTPPFQEISPERLRACHSNIVVVGCMYNYSGHVHVWLLCHVIGFCKGINSKSFCAVLLKLHFSGTYLLSRNGGNSMQCK